MDREVCHLQMHEQMHGRHSSVGEGDVGVPLAKWDSLREIFPLQTHWLPATGTLPMNDFRAD